MGLQRARDLELRSMQWKAESEWMCKEDLCATMQAPAATEQHRVAGAGEQRCCRIRSVVEKASKGPSGCAGRARGSGWEGWGGEDVPGFLLGGLGWALLSSLLTSRSRGE